MVTESIQKFDRSMSKELTNHLFEERGVPFSGKLFIYNINNWILFRSNQGMYNKPIKSNRFFNIFYQRDFFHGPRKTAFSYEIVKKSFFPYIREVAEKLNFSVQEWIWRPWTFSGGVTMESPATSSIGLSAIESWGKEKRKSNPSRISSPSWVRKTHWLSEKYTGRKIISLT